MLSILCRIGLGCKGNNPLFAHQWTRCGANYSDSLPLRASAGLGLESLTVRPTASFLEASKAGAILDNIVVGVLGARPRFDWN